MSWQTMYPAVPNSPTTTLSTGIDADDAEIAVTDASVFGATIPQLAVIGETEDAETVLITNRVNNTLTVIRAAEGTARAWSSGTSIARNFTAKDQNSIINNLGELNTLKAPLASPALTGTPTAPTATVGDSSTLIATTAFVKEQGYTTTTSGTFTLELAGEVTAGTPAYTSRNAHYYKIGKLCIITFDMVLSNLGGMAGSLIATGLPFAAANQASGNAGVMFNVNIPAGWVLGFYIRGAGIQFFRQTTTGAANISISELTNTSQFSAFSATYITE